MICPNCKESGVLNHANGIEFYYCRTCKIEIFLEDALKDEDGNKKDSDIKYPWGYFGGVLINSLGWEIIFPHNNGIFTSTKE